MRSRTAFARSGFVGPRLAKVVAAALYSGAVAEGRGWKYSRLRERLRGEPRADDLAVALDQAAVRLVREGELREAREDERVGEPEDERQDDHGDDGAAEGAHIMVRAPPRSARA